MSKASPLVLTTSGWELANEPNGRARSPSKDLTIYLLKEEVKDPEDAVRESAGLIRFTITAGATTVGDLYVRSPKSHVPRWAEFFEGHLDVAWACRIDICGPNC